MDSVKIIEKYFSILSQDQIEKYVELGELVVFWNQQINVISRKDLDNLYEKHILHSLGIAKVCSFSNGTSLLDIGTGGGFPGIPLAILFPECQFHLVDSIGKKIKVVSEIASSLKLKNVSWQHERAENVVGEYDFVISRAVTRMLPFMQWIKNKTHQVEKNSVKNGILYLKGGDLDEELAETGKDYELYNLSEFFEEEFFETKKVVHLTLP